MKVELRPYQTNAIRQIFNAWASKPEGLDLRNVLFQMPTGTGKTTLFSEIVRKAKIKDKKVLIVVHRLELVEQIVERLQHFDIAAGVIVAGKKIEAEKNVQVASIQTLTRRVFPPADLVIIDECHHSTAASYRKLWEIYPEARFLGVTATPIRLNKQGFDDLFDILIPAGQISDFVRHGYLVRSKHLVVSNPDVSHVKKSKGDYDTMMLKGVMLNNSLMANLIDSYSKHASGKKIIVFAVDIEHSKKIVARYLEAGIDAMHIDANTPKNERAAIMAKFRSGEIKVLSNVDIVSEGFDVPDCDGVQLARPTKSLGLYLQQVGRCLRPNPATGKEFGLILDNAGLWIEHGLAGIDRQWSLEGEKQKPKKSELGRQVAGFDSEGIVKEITIPTEAEGLELREMTEEIKRLMTFESMLTAAKNTGYKDLFAYYRFVDYLQKHGFPITKLVLEYCRMRYAGVVKDGFWFHQAKELIQ
jgi:superfamily II DNA or RNA helicase